MSAILVDIGKALNTTSASELQWIVSAYTIGSCVSFPIAGSLSDIFGRRWVIIVGQAVAIIGAVSSPPLLHAAILLVHTES